MDWILEHLMLVVLLVSGAIYILRAVTRAGSGQPEGEEEERPWIGGEDPEGAERTRRVQEDIRRRILERQQGGMAAPASPAPPPLPASSRPPVVVLRDEDEEPEWLEEGPRPRPALSKAPELDAAAAAILEQQRLLEQQFAAIRAAQALGSSAVPALPSGYHVTAFPAATPQGPSGGAVLRRMLEADLRNRAGFKRAVLLREILDTPPGLRR